MNEYCHLLHYTANLGRVSERMQLQSNRKLHTARLRFDWKLVFLHVCEQCGLSDGTWMTLTL